MSEIKNKINPDIENGCSRTEGSTDRGLGLDIRRRETEYTVSLTF